VSGFLLVEGSADSQLLENALVQIQADAEVSILIDHRDHHFNLLQV
jgi:hypothetical protein